MARERIGELLVRHELIDQGQLERALERQASKGGMLGENLVLLGYLDEESFLSALAEQAGTSYVTRKQMADSPVLKGFLKTVPVETAEDLLVFPVWFDRSTGELVLVVSNPTGAKERLEELRKNAGARKIKTVVALPSTIRAAIDLHYKGVFDAFDRLAESTARPAKQVDLTSVAPDIAIAWSEDIKWISKLGKKRRSRKEKAEGAPVVVYEPDPTRATAVQTFLQAEGYVVRRVGDRGQLAEVLGQVSPAFFLVREATFEQEPGLGDEIARLAPHAQVRRVQAFGEALVADESRYGKLLESVFETLELFIKYMNVDRGIAQSGPSFPRVVRQIGQRLGLGREQLDEVTVAAYLRELAREELKVPSVLEVTDETDRSTILEQIRIPIRFHVQLGIPVDPQPILSNLFERWDGQGVPEGRSGEDIPLGGRILSVVAAFQSHGGDPIPEDKEKIAAAFSPLIQGRGTYFDGRVVNTFLEVLEKGLLLGEIDVGLSKILIVDHDESFVDSLADPFTEKGHRVLRAPDLAKARELIEDYAPSVVAAEVKLPDGSGLELLADTKAGGGGPIFVFVASQQDEAAYAEAIEGGAEDFLYKSVGSKGILAKLERLLGRASQTTAPTEPRGVTGRLSDMALPDIIQTLSERTARVLLWNGEEKGSIWFLHGDIVHATAGDEEGEEAFYKLFRWAVSTWPDGTFNYSTVDSVERETIFDPNTNSQTLMLEAARQMDELYAGDYDEE